MNEDCFSVWWEREGQKVITDHAPNNEDLEDLARQAFEAGSSFCYYNINT